MPATVLSTCSKLFNCNSEFVPGRNEPSLSDLCDRTINGRYVLMVAASKPLLGREYHILLRRAAGSLPSGCWMRRIHKYVYAQEAYRNLLGGYLGFCSTSRNICTTLAYNL